MNNSKAIIIAGNPEARRVAASAARISTQQGTAMEIYARSGDEEKDLKLLDKVLSSGHKSVIEHQTFGIAFNDVSVLVEQFVIEARLASYTVKSRRYVDFSGAGYVVPLGLAGERRAVYDGAMAARFSDYEKLMALGVPKEDARFVLPYSLRSNFFMTVNARELVALVCAMLKGRGAGFGEIESLGEQLKEQFDERYPGVIDGELRRCRPCAAMPLPDKIEAPCEGRGDAELLSAPREPMALLEGALAFSGRFPENGEKTVTRERLAALLTDARPRELELLNYGFKVKRVSLACLTHFTRHRLQSPVIPQVASALVGGSYVLPESVRAIPEAESVYRSAFEAQAEAARTALALGVSPQDMSYFAMSGHQTDILLGANARELMHFMRLRTCSRAQWEIRGVAERMLALLRADTPELFELYGASCRFGPCPEGRMSCGRPQERIC